MLTSRQCFRKITASLFCFTFLLIVLLSCSTQSGSNDSIAATDINRLSQEITVKVDGEVPGSGTLVAFGNGKYHVLTTQEILTQPGNVNIVTKDGEAHLINELTLIPSTSLALGTFTSNEAYVTANIADNPQSVRQGSTVFVTGFNSEGTAISERRHQFSPGKVTDTKKGKWLSYDNRTLSGMNGGPVIDESGSLIGINNNDGTAISVEQVFNSDKAASILLSSISFLSEQEKELKSASKKNKQDWKKKLGDLGSFNSLELDKKSNAYILKSLKDDKTENRTIISLSKTNLDMNEIWEQRFSGIETTSSERVMTANLSISPSGEMCLYGDLNRDTPNPSGGANFTSHHTAWVALLNQEGNLLWRRDIDSPSNSNFNLRVSDVKFDSKDNMYVVGTGQGENIDSDKSTLLMKLSESGEIAWERILPITVQHYISDSILDVEKDDSVLVANGSGIVKISESGRLLWNKKVSKGSNSPFRNVLGTARGNGNISYVWGKTADSFMGFKAEQNNVKGSTVDEPYSLSDNFWIATYDERGTLLGKGQMKGDMKLASASDNPDYIYTYGQPEKCLDESFIGTPTDCSKENYALMRKYDSKGDLMWTTKVNLPDEFLLKKIRVLSQDDSIYCFGWIKAPTSWFTKRRTGMVWTSKYWILKYSV